VASHRRDDRIAARLIGPAITLVVLISMVVALVDPAVC